MQVSIVGGMACHGFWDTICFLADRGAPGVAWLMAFESTGHGACKCFARSTLEVL
jgi:hypothetical protein